MTKKGAELSRGENVSDHNMAKKWQPDHHLAICFGPEIKRDARKAPQLRGSLKALALSDRMIGFFGGRY